MSFGRNEELDIIASVGLDKSNNAIKKLNNDLKEIESRLKGKEFEIDINLSQEGMDKFKQHTEDVTKIAEDMSKSIDLEGANKEFDKAGISADGLVSKLGKVREQNELISQTVMHDIFQGYDFKQIDEYRAGIEETIRVIKNLDEDKNVESATAERNIDYLKAQNTLYKDLLDISKDINRLENLKISNKNIDVEKADQQLSGLKHIQNQLKTNISSLNLENEELDRQIEYYESIEKLKRDASIVDIQDRDSSSVYNDIIKLMKEQGQIQKQLVNADTMSEQTLTAQSNTLSELITKKRELLNQSGLIREEEEVRLRSEQERIDRSVETTQSQKAYKDMLQTLREINTFQKPDTDIFGDRNELEAYIKSLVGANAEIQDITTSLGESGFQQKQIKVLVDNLNGTLETRNLLLDESTQSLYEMSRTEKLLGDESLSRSQKQEKLYRDLAKLEKEILSTQSSKLRATEGGLGSLDRHEGLLRAEVSELRNALEVEGMISNEKEKQIELELGLQRARLEDRETRTVEVESADKYRELNAVMKEMYSNRQRALRADGAIADEYNQKADELLVTIASIQKEINAIGYDDQSGKKMIADEMERQEHRLQINSMQIEERENIRQSNELYRELLSLEKERIGIEGSLLNASEMGKEALGEQLELIKGRIKDTREEITSQDLINEGKEEEIRLEKELREAKLSDRVGKSEERDSREEYRELIALTKEYYSLQTRATKSSEDDAEIYNMRASDIADEIKLIEDRIALGDRELQQEEDKLQSLRESLQERLSVTELVKESSNDTKLQTDLYKELNRLQKDEFRDKRNLLKADKEVAELLNDRVQNTQESMSAIQEELSANKLLNSEKESQLQSEREILETNLEVNRIQEQNKGLDRAIKDYERLSREVKKYTILELESEGELSDSYSVKRELSSMQLKDKVREIALLQESVKLSEKEVQSINQRLEAVGKIHEEEVELAKARRQEQQRVRDRSLIEEDVRFTPEQFDYDDDYIKQVTLSHIEGAEEVTRYRKSLKGARGEVLEMVVATEQADGKIREFNVELERNSGELRKVGETVKEVSYRSLDFIEMLKFGIKRVFQWDMARMIARTVRKFATDGINFVRDLDKELTQVSIVTGRLRSETKSLADEYVRVGIEAGKTVDDIAKMNTELVRQGLSQEESLKRMQSVLELSSVGGVGSEKTLSIITSGVNALGEEVDTLSDILVKAGNISASSVESVGDALTKTASSAKGAGFETTDLVATISGLIEVTQESPSSLGNSLKTLTARYNRVNEETGELNTELNDVQKAFESVGITFTDQYGQIRPVFDLWTDLNDIWDDLDDNTQSYIANMSAGVMQQNRFMAIMDNFNRIQEINIGLQTASGETARNYAVYLDSVEASSNRAKASLQGLWVDTISSDAMKFIYDMAHILTEIVRELVGSEKLMKMLFLFLTTQLVQSTKMFDNLRRSIAYTFANTESLSLAFMTMFSSLKSQGMSSISVITNMLSRLKSVAQELKFGFDVGGISGMLSTSVGSTIALTAGMTGLVAVTTMAVGAFAKWVAETIKARRELKKLGDTVRTNIKGYRENIDAIQGMDEGMDDIIDKVATERSLTSLSTEEKQKYLDASSQISDMSPELVSGYTREGHALIRKGTTMDGVIEKQERLIELERIRLATEGSTQIEQESKKLRELSVGFDTLNKSLMSNYDSIDDMRSKNIDGIREEMELYERQIEEYSDVGELDKANELRVKYEKSRKELLSLEIEVEAETAKREQSIGRMSSILQAQLEIMDEYEEFSSTFQGRLIDGIEQIISETDGIDIEDTISDLKAELVGLLETVDPEELRSGAILIDDVAERFVELGMPVEIATELMLEYAFSQDEVSDTGEGAIYTVQKLSEGFKNLTNEISKLRSLQDKLSAGEMLSPEDLMFVLENFEDIAEYIDETGDLTLKNGDLLIEKIDEVAMEERKRAQQGIKDSQQSIENTKNEIVEMEKRLEIMKSSGKISEESYRTQQNLLKDKNKELKEEEKLLSNLMLQQRIYGQYMGQYQLEGDVTSASDGYKRATSDLKVYEDALEKLNKERATTWELMDSLIEVDRELIYYTGKEIELKDVLVETINKTKEEQRRYYKEMYMLSDSFSKDVYSNNKALFDNIASLYDLDLSNFRNLNQLKMAMVQELGNYSQRVTNAMVAGDVSEMRQMSDLMGTYMESADSMHYMTEKIYADELGSDFMRMSKAEQQRYKAQVDAMLSMEDAMSKRADFSIPAPTTLPSGSSSKSGRGAGSRASSRAMHRHIEDVELLTERYQKFDVALQEVERSLQMNNALLSHAVGKDRIALLRQEHYYLKEKQQLLSLSNIELSKEESEVRKRLQHVLNFEDGSMGIDSFKNYSEAVEKQINDVISRLNATTDEGSRKALEDRREQLQKTYDKTKEDFDRLMDIVPQKSDNSIEWWILEFEKLEQVLGQVEARFEGFTDRISKIDNLMKLNLTNREDSVMGLKTEEEALKDINQLYSDMLGQIEKEYDMNVGKLNEYKGLMESVGKENQEEYDRYRKRYIQTQALVNQGFEMYETNIFALQSSLETAITNISNKAQKELEEIKSKFEDIREEVDSFDFFNFEMSLREILYSLDKIDGIFAENTEFNLDTSKAREDVDFWRREILDFVDELERIDNVASGFDVVDGDSLDELESKKESLVDLIGQEIEFEQQLIDLAKQLNKEIAETEFRNKQIEDSIENQIAMKEKEVQALQDQYAEEDRIQAKMEKQLELLGALDDTRYSYITGLGEEVYTYDQSRVLALQKEIAQMDKEEERDEELEKRNKEIEKMREDLSKTKEINAEELQVLRLALSGINEIKSLTDKSISAHQETLERIFDKATEDRSAELVSSLDNFINVYERMWNNLIDGDELRVTFERREIDWERVLGGDRPDTDRDNDPDYDTGFDTPTPDYDSGVPDFPFDELSREMQTFGLPPASMAMNMMTSPSAINHEIDQSTHENRASNINVNNPVFNGVQDVENFHDEMVRLSRQGQRTM